MSDLHTDPPTAQSRDWLAEIDGCRIGDGMTGMEILEQLRKLAGILADLAREQVARLSAQADIRETVEAAIDARYQSHPSTRNTTIVRPQARQSE